MRLMRFLFLVFFISSIYTASAQTWGVRAGLNYSTFLGDKLPQEDHGYSGGFHFGITYAHDINDLFSIRTELVYIQNGSTYSYDGQSYYIIRELDKTTYEKGILDYDLNISNAYISIPIMANVRLNRKWEVFGGPYVNFLVGPTARGKLIFESDTRPEDIKFKQSLDFRYNNDDDREIDGRYLSGIDNPQIRVDGTIVTLPKFAGAYNQQGAKLGSRFKSIDFGLTAGAHYFLNRGFFVGFQVDYGFKDLTANDFDFSQEKLNDDNSFIKSNDKDSHFGIHASFGFRF